MLQGGNPTTLAFLNNNPAARNTILGNNSNRRGVKAFPGNTRSDDDDLNNTTNDSRSAAMMFDRSLVGDRNGMKTTILRAVYGEHLYATSLCNFFMLVI